jgi:hypothetical protein
VVLSRRSFSQVEEAVGFCAFSSASAPVTNGVAMEVPVFAT